MLEVLVIAGLVVAAVLAREASRRRALRRARVRAEGMLDDLAAAACAALAEPGRDRRAARAVERYGTARDRVAAATHRGGSWSGWCGGTSCASPGSRSPRAASSAPAT